MTATVWYDGNNLEHILFIVLHSPESSGPENNGKFEMFRKFPKVVNSPKISYSSIPEYGNDVKFNFLHPKYISM